MKNYITNCPNCGAPLKAYGYCEYCGTKINQPLQYISVRPGIKKLVCQTQIPLYIGEYDPKIASGIIEHDIKQRVSDALTDSIKFTTSRNFDPCRCEEIITVRGELWIADPSIYY